MSVTFCESLQPVSKRWIHLWTPRSKVEPKVAKGGGPLLTPPVCSKGQRCAKVGPKVGSHLSKVVKGGAKGWVRLSWYDPKGGKAGPKVGVHLSKVSKGGQRWGQRRKVRLCPPFKGGQRWGQRRGLGSYSNDCCRWDNGGGPSPPSTKGGFTNGGGLQEMKGGNGWEGRGFEG